MHSGHNPCYFDGVRYHVVSDLLIPVLALVERCTLRCRGHSCTFARSAYLQSLSPLTRNALVAEFTDVCWRLTARHPNSRSVSRSFGCTAAGDDFLKQHVAAKQATTQRYAHGAPSSSSGQRRPASTHGDGADDDDDHIDHHVTADEDEQDDKYMTEEEKDMVAVRCLRLFNVLLLLLGGGLCGASLWGSTTTVAGIGTSLVYGVAGVGAGIFIITLIGLVGACWRAQPVLLVYHTCLIFASFAMLVLGGFCFILTSSAVAWVKNNWWYMVSQLPPAQRQSLSLDDYANKLTFIMWGVGGTSIVLLLLLLCAMNSVIRLVTPLKAYTLLLQATNTTMLPVGIALISIAVWVADTAIGTEAVFSAFSIFVLGVFVILLVMVGCTGISLRSRGLIRLLFFITLLLTTAFLAFGITSLVAADKVNAAILSQWNNIRRVLPSSFAGKYDIEQFSAFMNSNLKALGFLALCTGMLLATQTFGAIRLRFELRAASELEEQAMEAAQEGLISQDDANALMKMRNPGFLEKAWKRNWSRGSKVSRCSIVFCCMFICFLVTVVVGVAVAALYYSTSCLALSNFSETYAYGGQDLGQTIVINNNYTRGSTTIEINELATNSSSIASTLTFTKSAYLERMAAVGYPGVQHEQMVTWSTDLWGYGVDASVQASVVTALPADGTRYLNFDVSCQDSQLTVTLPPATVLGGNGYQVSFGYPYVLWLTTAGDQTPIDIDLTAVPFPMRPRLYRLDMVTGAATIDAGGLVIGAKGVAATTNTGDITLDSLDAQCDPGDLGSNNGGVRMQTAFGGVSVTNAVVRDCEVMISGGAARCEVVDSSIANALGSSQLTMEAGGGVLAVTRTLVDVLNMKGDSGSVRLSNATIGQSVKVSTGTGLVSMDRMILALRAGIQVDTDSGDITVQATRFAGIVSIVTGGSISCSGRGFDDAHPCSTPSVDYGGDGSALKVIEQVDVNCQAIGDCAYLGGVTVTSARGNVNIVMDKWTRA